MIVIMIIITSTVTIINVFIIIINFSKKHFVTYLQHNLYTGHYEVKKRLTETSEFSDDA